MQGASTYFVSNLPLLDKRIIERAKHALTVKNLEMVTDASLYFFPDGKGIDEDDPNSFTGLCLRNRQDPDAAAKAIWERLTPERRELIIEILIEKGCY